jgi:hypothetical protein
VCRAANQELSRPCVGLGMEMFVRRWHVVPVEEASVRPDKSGVCVPGCMSAASHHVWVGGGEFVRNKPDAVVCVCGRAKAAVCACVITWVCACIMVVMRASWVCGCVRQVVRLARVCVVQT